MAQEKQWIVITSGEEPLEAVSKALKEKGFTVESKLEAIGQIIGTGSEAAIRAAKRLKGVADVQPSHEINIGPPGEGPAW